MAHLFRARSAKNVVDEIDWLVNDSKAKHMPSEMIHSSLIEIEISWSCSSRDTIGAELLKIMRSAGCVAIYYGIETRKT